MEAPDHRTEIQLQERLMKSLAALPRFRNGSPEQAQLPVPQPPGARSLEQATADDTPMPSPHYHQGHFGPAHGLSPQEAWQAEQLLRQKTPFRGPHAQQKEAARIAGIVSSVKNGRLRNSRWGRSMLARKGGLALKAHGLHILREQAPRGGRAAANARAKKKALQHFEQTGEVLPLKSETGQRIPALDAWTAWKVSSMPFMLW